MWSCQYCALSERCQFCQIESLSTPLKNCAIATLQPHNLSPRLSGQWNIHISSSKSKIISFRVPGAHNYNYFLNSLPQLNGELAYRLTKSIFTITMMKWILMPCNLCKTSYNVLMHSHVIILELKFWGEFRFPPSHPGNVVPLFELPLENNKHPNFEWRGRGGVWILMFSEVTLFEYNVSTILSPIV